MPSACRRWPADLALGLALVATPAVAEGLRPDDTDVFGNVDLEATGFAEAPQFPGQKRHDASLAGQATFLAEWADGDLAFRFTPFGRVDAADRRRTHWDIRELEFDLTAGDWSFTLGADTVFWGKTEAVNLVDIINQTDAVEDIDDEDRLGQPMLKVARIMPIGEVSAFVMPWFRERTFPGRHGRLRSEPLVDADHPIYSTGAEEWTPSFAVRYAGAFGGLDLGLSAFHGLSRDPAFFFDGAALRPVYERITQAGFDAQYTSGATLWKAEGLYRWGQRNLAFAEEEYAALTGGLEHTLFGIADSNADLGLIAEYAWDSRGDKALTMFQNDLILGARLTLNDTQDTAVLLTGAVDTTDGGVTLRLEAERRLTAHWKAEIEGFAFLSQDRLRVGGALAEDSFLRITLVYSF